MARRLAGRTAANPISKRGAAGRKVAPRKAPAKKVNDPALRNRGTSSAKSGNLTARQRAASSDRTAANRGTSSPRSDKPIADAALRNRGTTSRKSAKLRGYGGMKNPNWKPRTVTVPKPSTTRTTDQSKRPVSPKPKPNSRKAKTAIELPATK